MDRGWRREYDREAGVYAPPRSSSRSGIATKISTAIMVMRNRNALGTPFHCCDCHIPNHSPPIDMKPTCQSRKPRVKPATAKRLARLNAPASAESRRGQVSEGDEAREQRDGRDGRHLRRTN